MNFWTVFCGSSVNLPIIYPESCVNNIFVISFDVMLLLTFLFVHIYRLCTSKRIESSGQSQKLSCLLVLSTLFNFGLGLVYIGLGIYLVIEELGKEQTILPLHGWLVVLFQGITWISLSLIYRYTMALRNITATPWVCAILALLLAGFLCVSSVWVSIVEHVISVKNVVDMLCFPGSILLICCVIYKKSEIEFKISCDGFDIPLLGENVNDDAEISSAENLTPFANAGFLSRLSFWWLNPLMKLGKEKNLQDKDIPRLGQADRAKTCYMAFMDQLSKRKSKGSSSILSTIFYWHWKNIIISGLCALVKVLTLATGPLLLKAFILVAEGKEAFEYEGYALTAALFLAKCLESLSERQWIFRTRLIGLHIRSMLSAAIYKKQLRLSNAAKLSHSPGEIINYVTIDAYRLGEFPSSFHQIWTTSLQICLALIIMYYSVGLATVAALVVVIITVLGNSPLAKLQHKYQSKLMSAQDKRLKAVTEALTNMKILKLYTWETNFKKVIEKFRKEETEWLSNLQTQKGYFTVLFWSSPILVAATTFWACYFLGISLDASRIFTFLATLRIVQEPIRLIPDVAGAFIEAKVSLDRIVRFLEAPELEDKNKRNHGQGKETNHSIFIRATSISWESNSLKSTLRNINLKVKSGEMVAICGEVGSGKSTLLAAILGEVPNINGIVQVNGSIGYVSQASWIQTGTLRENIVFGSAMEPHRYNQVLEKCSLVKDLDMLPFGDLTEIGERGINLSGGQKQRVQLARALYQDADIYLLDDPFSAVDAQTATSLFNEYVMEALSGKTVLLVTHQVDFLPALDTVLLISEGEIIEAASYHQLLVCSQEFQSLVNAHNDTTSSDSSDQRSVISSPKQEKTTKDEITNIQTNGESGMSSRGDQLILQEKRETGDTGLKPFLQYLSHRNGMLYFSMSTLAHIIFVAGMLIQNYWLAANIKNYSVNKLMLFSVYSAIGVGLAVFLFIRSLFIVLLSVGVSKSVHSTLLRSLFRAPMSFYDSTPLGRILSLVSSDLSIIDLDVAFKLTFSLGAAINTYSSFGVLVYLTWQILVVVIPMIYLTILLQRYYFASAKELMRINGTTKSLVANHLSESIAGSMTIRAFGEEDRFFLKNLDLIDTNASPLFHTFTANEWLIQRLEILCALVLSSSVLAITLLSLESSSSGFIGMAISYGLSMNVFVVFSIQNQCMLGNSIISVERVEQYMHIPSEAPEMIVDNQPPINWPFTGKVEIIDLKVRYQLNAPLVLRGITCTFEGQDKIGIVGRTGSGKTTLLSVLFRLVEPTEGKIIIDGVDISTIGLHDLRSHIGIIPQDPTLFGGTVRFNLDPLSKHTDHAIWEALEKCKLKEAIQEKEEGLDSLVVQDGSNWSMGQRQLFCLGRALLKKSRILVLDEATASIDNTTDAILQKTIRTEFDDSTVITVAHRIPTVMDCTKVLAISDGKLVEFDTPTKLMNMEKSLFAELVKEYWSRTANATS